MWRPVYNRLMDRLIDIKRLTARDRNGRRIQGIEPTVDVARGTIRNWVKRGHFPKPRRLSASRIGWLESELKEWIESRRST